MKIVNAEIRLHELLLKSVFRNSLASKDRQKSISLVLTSDEGLKGVSSIEPDTPNYSEETWYEIIEVVNRELIPILLSEEFSNIQTIIKKMDLKIYGHFMSKSLIETALYDIFAKRQKTQVFKLLGGKSTRPIPLIGWVGISKIDERIAETRKFIDEEFGCIKYKISSDINATEDLLSEVRKQFGYGFQIRLDANQSLNENLSKQLIRNISRLEISLLEQPLNRDNLEGMASITRESSIPIMADEGASSIMAVRNLIRIHACNMIKIKVLRSGGLDAAMRIASLAKEDEIKCVVGNGFSTSLGTSIEANFYLGDSYIEKYAEFVGPLKLKEDIVSEPMKIVKGNLIPREGFGYGYENQLLNP